MNAARLLLGACTALSASALVVLPASSLAASVAPRAASVAPRGATTLKANFVADFMTAAQNAMDGSSSSGGGNGKAAQTLVDAVCAPGGVDADAVAGLCASYAQYEDLASDTFTGPGQIANYFKSKYPEGCRVVCDLLRLSFCRGQPRRVAITTFWDGSLSYECALPLWCQSAARLSAVLPEALAPEVVLIAPKPSPECPQAKRRAMLTRASRGLRTVRTRGAGQLAPGPHARSVRRTRTSFGRAVRTAYRGTTTGGSCGIRRRQPPRGNTCSACHARGVRRGRAARTWSPSSRTPSSLSGPSGPCSTSTWCCSLRPRPLTLA